MVKKRISILGATGSIGDSTLKVVRNNREKFALHSVIAHQNVEKMFAICAEFSPQYAVLEDKDAAQELKERCRDASLPTKVLGGEEAILSLVAEPEVEIVVAAIVGAKGFLSSLAAVRAGKTILLANKETLVVGGELFMAEVERSGAVVLPIDSEHNALFQCLPKTGQGASLEGVKRLILTASGGPFRGKSRAELEKVTVEAALKHPNWSMGPKVTIDSSTLMNKGLEFIEAHFLFNMPADSIGVLVHPESIIHSLVEYRDGTMLAQLGEADMAIPIAHALGYPERLLSGAKALDLVAIGQLNFEAPDLEAFPALRLAKESLLAGTAHLVTLNAANEILVEAFLERRIGYMEIPTILEQMLAKTIPTTLKDEEALLAFDAEIRTKTLEQIAKR